MSLIGSIGSLNPSSLYGKVGGSLQAEGPGQAGSLQKISTADLGPTQKTEEGGFGKMFSDMIESVDSKQADANKLSKQVLLGQTDQLHTSVIAMQEASVAFSLMVEVRNKLVDSYQELMRMPV